MNTTLQPQLPSAREETQAGVKSAFEAPEWYFNKLNFRIQLRQEVVRDFTRDLVFERFLDIGCGDGSVSLQLLKPGRRLTLQDLSEAMLTRARGSIPSGMEGSVETCSGDFLQGELPVGAYGLVICLGVLSYVERLDAFLEKLSSLVAPGGHVIIECTDGTHFVSRILRAYSGVTELVRPPKVSIALQAHSSARVALALKELGFELIGRYQYSSPPPVIRTFFSQRFHCAVNRFLHGRAGHNRLARLGTEHIFHFQRKVSRQAAGFQGGRPR